MKPAGGFGPPTPGLQNRCSAVELRRPDILLDCDTSRPVAATRVDSTACAPALSRLRPCQVRADVRAWGQRRAAIPLRAMGPVLDGPCPRLDCTSMLRWRGPLAEERFLSTSGRSGPIMGILSTPIPAQGPPSCLKGAARFFERRRKWLEQSGRSLPCFGPVALQIQGTARRSRAF